MTHSIREGQNECSRYACILLPLRIGQQGNERKRVPLNRLHLESKKTTTFLVYGPEGTSSNTRYLRCAIETAMSVESTPKGSAVHRELQPGEACEAVVKIPHIALQSEEELRALIALQYKTCK